MSTNQPRNSPHSISDAAVAASSTGGRQQRRRGGRGRGRGRGRPTADRPDNNVGSSTPSAEKPTNNNGRRRGRGGRTPNERQPSEAPVSPNTNQALEFIDGSLQDSSEQTIHQQVNGGTSNHSEQTPAALSDNTKKKKRRNRNRKRNKANRPWLSAIPPETADPISLDPLEDLPYPPFALVMDEPYTPIYPGMWPPPALETVGNNAIEETDADLDREVNILKAQWGEAVVRKEESDTSSNKAKPPSDSLHGRQFYLFDGKVLAYYLTETKQFINPYNRRDLTRPELEALDYYMAVHKLGNAGVVQAYDEKGVALSTAGVAGQTAEGRAQIMQQEANAIRNTFFQSSAGNEGASNQTSSARQQSRSRRQGHNSNGRSEPVDGITNELQRMYQNQNNNREDNRPHTDRENEPNDLGIYGGEDGGGFLMIDDDINPGLRSGVPSSHPGSSYSARHIAERHSQQAQAQEESFPTLSAVTPTTTGSSATTSITQNPTSAPSSKSLKKITKVVKKTNPAELARQKKAREEALRKAELSRLSFFDPTASRPSDAHNGLLTAPIPVEKLPPTEAVLERNRNFANALGVVPAQMRNAPVLTGWARPTTVEIQLDEFGNDINSTQYPDSLLAKAKERMTELLKLERTWKKFLADDKEASCSLKPMDRASRVFVHEYSDFWRLSTQSYDPEGRRYIHCSKLLDTSAPHPLLSDAAKKWRGPAPGAPPVPYRAPVSIPSTSTSAAASEPSSDGWHTEQRKPLKLAPRTIDEGNPQPDMASTMGMTRSTSTPLLSMTGEVPAPQRFADLHQERPKLQLAPRTIIPSDENQKLEVQNERAIKKEEARIHRQEYKVRKQKIQEQKKKAILESAFASDDDGVDWSDDSDWFEDDAIFEGSDDEGR